jgi:hypothetical protein
MHSMSNILKHVTLHMFIKSFWRKPKGINIINVNSFRKSVSTDMMANSNVDIFASDVGGVPHTRCGAAIHPLQDQPGATGARRTSCALSPGPVPAVRGHADAIRRRVRQRRHGVGRSAQDRGAGHVEGAAGWLRMCAS